MRYTRPAKCYQNKKQAYTRKEYMRRYPELPEGLRKFTFGNTSKFDFAGRVSLVAQKNGVISAKSLEAIRIATNRELKVLGNKYRLQIKTIPFHVVRQHGLIGVAKAERFVKGMRQSFGKPTLRVARVKRGTAVVEVLIPDQAVAYHVCKKALNLAAKKLAIRCRLESDGISPKNIKATPRLPKRPKKTGADKRGL